MGFTATTAQANRQTGRGLVVTAGEAGRRKEGRTQPRRNTGNATLVIYPLFFFILPFASSGVILFTLQGLAGQCQAQNPKHCREFDLNRRAMAFRRGPCIIQERGLTSVSVHTEGPSGSQLPSGYENVPSSSVIEYGCYDN